MRYVFAAWALPVMFIWSWFFLSYYDMHFGYIMLTREMHDLVFEIYGEMLGIDPKLLPGMLAKACILDTLIIVAIWAFRRRRNIIAWFRSRRETTGTEQAYAEAASSRSL
jgi:hypothetical protein